MKVTTSGWFAAILLTVATGMATAQAPAGAPAGTNGICKDGSYSTSASKAGACRGHKGVQTWYAAAPATAATPATKLAPATAMKSAPASTTRTAAMPAPAPAPAASAPARPAPTPMVSAPAAMPASAAAAPTGKRLSPTQAAAMKTAAPGGGAGLVWVNTATNVYHCNGDAFYGKTKAGAYMSEADAKAKGAHGERGKGCSAT